MCGIDELAGLVADMKRGVPWEAWAAAQPRIAAAVRAAAMPDDEESAVLPPPPPGADAPLADLLSFQWRCQYPRAVRHRLRTTTDLSEIRLLRDAAVGPWGPARKLAMHALGERGDSSALAIAAEVFDRDVVGQERASAFRYFLALEARVILPLAREWLEIEGDRWSVAVATMALHCEREDVTSVRRAFALAWQEGAMYEVCDLVDALARLVDDGPHPEVRLAYEEIAYSFGRRRAAAALARTDQSFASTYAAESLWDCESETRMIGAEAADTSCDHVRARLRRLADDPFEDDVVRQVARAAL